LFSALDMFVDGAVVDVVAMKEEMKDRLHLTRQSVRLDPEKEL